MTNIILPQHHDFITAFGCEYESDQDLNHSYKFLDNNNNCLIINIFESENAFSLELKLNNNYNIINFYSEFLSEIRIDSDNQLLFIKMNKSEKVETIQILIWPDFKIKFISMNNNH